MHPDNGYLKNLRKVCDMHNVLMVVDEIQTGLGRTGKLLACNWEDVKPDLLVLGKSLSGGYYPLSAVLGDDKVMNCIRYGDHDTTYGNNPMAAVIGRMAVEVLLEEGLIENSRIMGEHLYKGLKSLQSPLIKEIRGGKGLYCGLVINEGMEASKVAEKLIENGLIAKATRGNVIRLMPPLVIRKDELELGLEIIQTTLKFI